MNGQEEVKNDNLIREKSFVFALLIIDCYKFLNSKNEYVLSKQLLRSGTSIGANIEEAQASQSRKDFLSKMSIASKEARETLYWLKLLKASNYLDEYPETDKLLEEINSIINILTKIVKTVGSSVQK
ncbi:MAG: four helix bundle protein [Candidatus Anstonellaceae archaeon]